MTHLCSKMRYLKFISVLKKYEVSSLWRHQRYFSFTATNGKKQSNDFRPTAIAILKKAIAIKPKKWTLKSYVTTIILEFFPLKTMLRADLIRGTSFLYDDLIEQVDVSEFITEFDMPDTFDSWFKIVELHVFILSARLMEDEKCGLAARDYLWDTFWKDVEHRHCRMLPLGRQFPPVQYKLYRRVSKFMFAAYDEGLQSEDRVLASAIWRRVFMSNCENPLHIERLVKYIRHEIDYQRKIPFKDFMFKKNEWFIPLSEIRLETDLGAPKTKLLS